MTEWKVKIFRPKHLKKLTLRPEDKGRTNRWKEAAKKSVAYSFYDEKGRFVFCGGVLIHYNGFGEGWLMCGEEVKYYPVTVYRYIKKYLESIIYDNNLHRVQATVRCDWPQAQKFISKLGFKYEGLLHKYGIDQGNYTMNARIE